MIEDKNIKKCLFLTLCVGSLATENDHKNELLTVYIL